MCKVVKARQHYFSAKNWGLMSFAIQLFYSVGKCENEIVELIDYHICYEW